MSRTMEHAALALVLCSAATSYGQQPPQPACNHQWVPDGGPVLGSPTNPPCGQAATPPHTAFQVDASEFYRGYVDTYQGQQTQCIFDTVTLTLPGECGGTNQGQPVTCMPEIPGYSSSSVSDAVTTNFSYEVFVETGSTGSISCKYSDTVKDNTPTLSASLRLPLPIVRARAHVPATALLDRRRRNHLLPARMDLRPGHVDV